jgi:hypothetical protein
VPLATPYVRSPALTAGRSCRCTLVGVARHEGRQYGPRRQHSRSR